MPSNARVRSTTSTIFFLPVLERWDRPTAASLRASGVHPGRLAQGPDEKSGRAGRMFGFVINLSLPEELHSGGGAWPAARIRGPAPAVNAWQLSQIPNMCEQHAGRADTNRRTLVAGNSGDARDRRRLGAGRRILRPHLLRPRDDAISPPVRADLRLGRLSLPDAQRAIGVRAGRTGGAGLRAERAELRVRPDDQAATHRRHVRRLSV